MAVGMNCNFGFQEAVDGVSMLPFAEWEIHFNSRKLCLSEYILTTESSTRKLSWMLVTVIEGAKKSTR